ncbi:S41 family peptidase [Dyadobacter subterraneus]|uniref:Peptidase S41 n=1 Tax=Dyadobacter subterraneus TaxID=2773304 RepID=A0ABR9WLD3_9BACT|nr:S41 family peptidase [Dyadobacter subterraneus]MBE9466325.1 peptidase S41 [Dyadobacter subterraneus]
MKKVFVLLLFVTGFLAACHEKNVDPATNTETNQWILDQMKTWYYWNDKITANPDLNQEPEAFFNSLLYKFDATSRPDGDRFSWIESDADALKAELSGSTKTTGMELKLFYYPTGGSNIVGLVAYTLPGSPAALAGIKRGAVFTRINDQKLTASNYYDLVYSDASKTFTMGSLTDKDSIVETTVKKDVTPVSFQEDPVFFDTTFQYGSNTIGYLVYHQFITSKNGSDKKEYDTELDNKIAAFKAKNVNSLILDLRYNPGGYVSSATNLASLIGKNISDSKVFYYKGYNATITPVLQKEYGDDYFNDKFASKSQNIGSNLTNLIVLVSSRTASASELLINGLKPYMTVTLVGDKTVGKNVGSITLSDKTGKVKWGLQPIVTRSYNSLKQSDYSTGFTPDIAAKEGLRLYPYGNPKDPLLAAALAKIVGSPVTRQTPEALRISSSYKEVMSTIERKAGGSNMFFDK